MFNLLLKSTILYLFFLNICHISKAQNDDTYIVEPSYYFDKGYFSYEIFSDDDKDTIKVFLGNTVDAVSLIEEKRFNFSTMKYKETPVIRILDSQSFKTLNLYSNSKKLTIDDSYILGSTFKENPIKYDIDVVNTGETKTIDKRKCTKWTVSYEKLGYKHSAELWLTKGVVDNKNAIRLAFSSTTLYPYFCEEFLNNNLFPIEIKTTYSPYSSKVSVRNIKLLEVDMSTPRNINTEEYKKK